MKGFTLIELVITIIILGVVGIGLGRYIGIGAQIYSDVISRDQLLSDSRYVIQRLTREIREAVPNSVRVNATINNRLHCIEFIPILASSTYINLPTLPQPARDNFLIVQPAESTNATRIAVHPLTPNQLYVDTVNQLNGRAFDIQATPGSGTNVETLTLINAVNFAQTSPVERYYLFDTAVSYCANLDTGEIKRYSNYWLKCLPNCPSQMLPPINDNNLILGSVAVSLMAENLQNNSSESPFIFQGATLISNAVVQLDFLFGQDDERVEFYHEIHIINVP